MPRFLRSAWAKPANQPAEAEVADTSRTPEILEQLERIREEAYVRDLQKRLMALDTPVANEDENPGVKNIFAPVERGAK